jgi:hypothetical protein
MAFEREKFMAEMAMMQEKFRMECQKMTMQQEMMHEKAENEPEDD